MASEVGGAGVPIVCYNLHIESRGNDELRLTQMNEVLRDAVEYGSLCLQIIAGDLNLNASKPPAAEALAHAGFREVVPTARVPTTPARHLLAPGRHIDWAFVRGAMATDQGRVHNQAKGSDHTRSRSNYFCITKEITVVPVSISYTNSILKVPTRLQ